MRQSPAVPATTLQSAVPSPAKAPAGEAVLEDVPDAGLWPGVLYRLGVKREAAVWGGRFLLASPGIDATTAWHVRNGRYELPEARLALRHMDPSLPLVELGGGLGVLACLLNRRLARPEDHAVVEMNPAAADLIERNRALNGARFRLVRAALHYGAGRPAMSGTARRFDGGNRVVGPAQAGPAAVLAEGSTTLAALAKEAGWRRFNLLVDIEGMEAELVAREADVLARHVETLVLELHPKVLGGDGCARTIERLGAAGFRMADWIGDSMAFVHRDAAPRAGGA